MSITRIADTDDDGTGTVGTIRTNAWLQSIYDSIELTWAWNSVTHSDANFAGDGTDSNWVVALGDQSTFKYLRVGKKLTVILTVVTSTVANTPGTLQVTIPGSFTAATAAGGTFWYDENGTDEIGRWYVDAAGTLINLVKISGTWANATNTTTVQAVVTFEIQ